MAFFGNKLTNESTTQAETTSTSANQSVASAPASQQISYAERNEKERLLRRALPDAQAAATNWIHSNGMYGKPPSRFIRDITRILFDPNELASNRVTTLDKKWVGIICKEAIDAYPNNAQATSGAVRNIISTMCSEARVSLGYSKSKSQRVKRGSNSSLVAQPSPSPSTTGHLGKNTQFYGGLVKQAIAEASHNQQLCLN